MALAKPYDVSVVLTEEEVAWLAAARDAGDSRTPGEIVREALLEWHAKRGARPDEAVILGRLWDQGKSSGCPQPLDIESTIAAAKKRFGTAA